MADSSWLQSRFKTAEENGASHMIIVCDTFDYEDYPVYVMPGDNVRVVEADYRCKSMQRVMEVYKISLGWEAQFVGRVFNY
jgi:hypothetical protein